MSLGRTPAIFGGLASIAAAAGGGACIASQGCSLTAGWGIVGTAAIATVLTMLLY